MSIVTQLMNGVILTQQIEEEKGQFDFNDTKPYKRLKVVQTSELNEGGVKEGDTVYVPKKAGVDVEINNTKYTTINYREIILIL